MLFRLYAITSYITMNLVIGNESFLLGFSKKRYNAGLATLQIDSGVFECEYTVIIYC